MELWQAAAHAKENESWTAKGNTAEERDDAATQGAIDNAAIYADQYGVDKVALIRYLQGYRD